MPNDALRAALISLKPQLRATNELDADTRALLVDALLEVTATLDRCGAPIDDVTLGESIVDAVDRFEGEHPNPVSAVARVAHALGAAGI